MSTEDPQSPFSEQQVESLKSLVSGIVNSAISNRDKMSDKKRADDRAAVQADFAKLLDEKLQALKPTEGEGDGKDGKGKRSKGDDLELSTLRQKMADLERVSNENLQRAKAAEERRREGDRQQRVRESLAKGGIVDPFKQELALAHFDRKGRVAWSGEEDDASLVWNGDDGSAVSYDEGLSGWLKTEEAKHFLPPKGTGGSGSRPGSLPTGGVKPTKQQAEEQAWAAAGEALRGAFGGTNGSL